VKINIGQDKNRWGKTRSKKEGEVLFPGAGAKTFNCSIWWRIGLTGGKKMSKKRGEPIFVGGDNYFVGMARKCIQSQIKKRKASEEGKVS